MPAARLPDATALASESIAARGWSEAPLASCTSAATLRRRGGVLTDAGGGGEYSGGVGMVAAGSQVPRRIVVWNLEAWNTVVRLKLVGVLADAAGRMRLCRE